MPPDQQAKVEAIKARLEKATQHINKDANTPSSAAPSDGNREAVRQNQTAQDKTAPALSPTSAPCREAGDGEDGIEGTREDSGQGTDVASATAFMGTLGGQGSVYVGFQFIALLANNRRSLGGDGFARSMRQGIEPVELAASALDEGATLGEGHRGGGFREAEHIGNRHTSSLYRLR